MTPGLRDASSARRLRHRVAQDRGPLLPGL